jgi:hypothetical protein
MTQSLITFDQDLSRYLYVLNKAPFTLGFFNMACIIFNNNSKHQQSLKHSFNFAKLDKAHLQNQDKLSQSGGQDRY